MAAAPPYRILDTKHGDRVLPIFTNAGAPSNGTTGTLAGAAGIGTLLLDTTNAVLYQNSNTLLSPTWTALTTATGAGTYTGTFDGLVGSITPAAAIATTIAGTDATDSTTTTTGALKTAGGLGVVKAAFIGTTLNVAGIVTMGSIGTALTAVGTSRTDALALTKQFNKIATVGATTAGVILPASAVGVPIFVWNSAASNSMHIYGAGSDTIDGNAGSAGVTMAHAMGGMFMCVATNTYVSFAAANSA